MFKENLPMILALLLILVIIAAISGCTTARGRLDVGLGTASSFGNDSEHKWKGDNPTLLVRYSQPINDWSACEYQHISNISNGAPFNDDDETSLDAFTCFVFLQVEDADRR